MGDKVVTPEEEEVIRRALADISRPFKSGTSSLPRVECGYFDAHTITFSREDVSDADIEKAKLKCQEEFIDRFIRNLKAVRRRG